MKIKPASEYLYCGAAPLNDKTEGKMIQTPAGSGAGKIIDAVHRETLKTRLLEGGEPTVQKNADKRGYPTNIQKFS